MAKTDDLIKCEWVVRHPYLLDGMIGYRDTGSMTKAAEQYANKTVSVLSREFKEAEDRLGFSLIDKRSKVLTEEAVFLLDNAQAAHKQMAEAMNTLKWKGENIKNDCAIQCSSILSTFGATAISQHFQATEDTKTHFYLAARPDHIALRDWPSGWYSVWVGNAETIPEEGFGDDTEFLTLKYPKPAYWCDWSHPYAQTHLKEDGKIHADISCLQHYPAIAPVGIPRWWEMHWLKWLYDIGVPVDNSYRQTSPLHIFTSNDAFSQKMLREDIFAFDGGTQFTMEYLNRHRRAVYEVVLDDEPKYQIGEAFIAWRKGNETAERIAADITALVQADNIKHYGHP